MDPTTYFTPFSVNLDNPFSKRAILGLQAQCLAFHINEVVGIQRTGGLRVLRALKTGVGGVD